MAQKKPKMVKRREKRKPGFCKFKIRFISTEQYSLILTVTYFSLVEEKSLEGDMATLTIEDKLVRLK